MTKIKQTARYRLHARVRRDGWRLVTKLRTFYTTDADSEISSTAMKELCGKFGYCIQLTIDN